MNACTHVYTRNNLLCTHSKRIHVYGCRTFEIFLHDRIRARSDFDWFAWSLTTSCNNIYKLRAKREQSFRSKLYTYVYRYVYSHTGVPNRETAVYILWILTFPLVYCRTNTFWQNTLIYIYILFKASIMDEINKLYTYVVLSYYFDTISVFVKTYPRRVADRSKYLNFFKRMCILHVPRTLVRSQVDVDYLCSYGAQWYRIIIFGARILTVWQKKTSK